MKNQLNSLNEIHTIAGVCIEKKFSQITKIQKQNGLTDRNDDFQALEVEK